MSLTAQNIAKSFSGQMALASVSLSLVPGSIHALVGENGAGKSTLLKIMAGISRPDGGEVALDGQHIYENPDAKGRVAFVPTQCALFPGYTSKQLVRLFRSMYRRFDETKFLSAMSGLETAKKSVRHLSTGMQMTLSVALAMATMPDVLLLDEPFAGLDVVFRRRLIQLLIDECEGRPISILVSSHNVDELERLCDRATFLSRGEIVCSGELHDIKQHSIKRLQLVFSGEAPQNLADWPDVVSVENLGRVFTLNVDGASNDIERRLRDVGVVMLEELPVTLEEAFLYRYQQGGKRA